MYKLNRVAVVSMAVLLTYNAYAEGGYVCDDLKRYVTCEENFYMTIQGRYNPKLQSGNDCTACPTGTEGAEYCYGGLAGPLYKATLDKNAGDAQAAAITELYVFASPGDSDTTLNVNVCNNSVISDDNFEACFGDNGTITALTPDYFPVRDKYNFAGFATRQDATVADAIIFANGTMDTDRLSWGAPSTLYAVWELAFCDPNYYLEDGECKPCVAPYANSDGGAGGQNTCYLTTEPGKYVAEATKDQVPCDNGHYCEGEERVYYNSTSTKHTYCPSEYDDGGTGLSAISQCAWNVEGGYYIKNAEDLQKTECDGEKGEWKAAHTVTWGQSSAPESCGELYGVKAESIYPYNAKTLCSIPSDQPMNDGKGQYTFTMPCGYTEGTN